VTGQRAGRFLGWLSSESQTNPSVTAFGTLSSNSGTNTIPLVSSGDTSNTAGELHIVPTPSNLNGSQGAYAWITSGENAKATLQSDVEPAPSGTGDDSLVDWSNRVRSNGRVKADSLGFPSVDLRVNNELTPSNETLAILDGNDFTSFHTAGTHGVGLLTNTATGGWRKDLSVFAETYSSLPATGFPTLQQTPLDDPILSSKASVSYPQRPLIYPWCDYINQKTGSAETFGASSSWTGLVQYMRQYQNLQNSSSTSIAMPLEQHGTTNTEGWLIDVERGPVITRVQVIISLDATPSSTTSGKYNPALYITPLISVWNPHNVEINVDKDFGVRLYDMSPYSFTFNVGDEVLGPLSIGDITKGLDGNADKDAFHVKSEKAPFVLQPGESAILFPQTSPTASHTRQTLPIGRGFKGQYGFLFNTLSSPESGSGAYVTKDFPASAEFELANVTYAADVSGGTNLTNPRRGISMKTELAFSGYTGHYEAFYDNSLISREISNALEIDLGEDDTGASLASLAAGPAQPILIVTTYKRGFDTIPLGDIQTRSNTDHTIHNSKGFLSGQVVNNECVLGTSAYSSKYGRPLDKLEQNGVLHPWNAPLANFIEQVDSWNSTSTPQFELDDSRAYFMSGFLPGTGVSRMIASELPLRPIQSLGELQNFDATHKKPVPPFSSNLIGNSSAQPLFLPDRINTDSNSQADLGHMCNDDSYILNNLLFDDWFVSSISEQPSAFSATGGENAESVMSSLLNETAPQPLPNRFYMPAAHSTDQTTVSNEVDRSMSASEGKRSSIDKNYVGYGYESVAAALEVRGMFNINSTSVEAWEALLKQGQNSQVPYYTGTSVALDTDTGTSVPFPRTSIAGAARGSSIEQLVSGYPTLSEGQIGELATLIVQEVRARGPFLSLSEFVNRRLTNSDNSRALAGVIEYAIDHMATDPNAELKTRGQNVAVAHIPGDPQYKFNAAAEGSTLYGVPGWLRQADVIKPIAPLMSARDDTFTIRAYGDARAANGNIVSQAWCEVLVQRTAEFVDPADHARSRLADLTSPINEVMGRKYKILSFRWLDESEIN